ncbi:MAG: hypothetical protein JST04_06380 [Bdellovibrionales bacterium]|nr:hypothetical protein [Bdellovibrionales bacterium]
MREGENQSFRPALLGAGCTSAAGDSIAATWEGVLSGKNFARPVDSSAWTVAPRFVPRACSWKTPDSLSALDQLVAKTLVAYREALAELPDSARARVRDGSRLGVILATTKGALDDEIWKGEGVRLETDFFSPILDEFLRASELRPRRRTCVSNACASALSAFGLASDWLADGELEDVLVLAVDRIGPFVLHGFHSLRAVTADVPRPFGANRSGLLLGEASAALFFSRHGSEGDCEFRLAGVGIDAEGHAVTRPDDSGASLRAACESILAANDRPDLVIAHGTATEVNDPVEARVLADLFPAADVPITASKGALGHTLGASGAIDLLLAREVLRRGETFTISQTTVVDSAFRGKFLVSPDLDRVEKVPGDYRRVLVTSLGFGGIHAAAMLERGDAAETNAVLPKESTANARPAKTAVPEADAHAFAFPVKVAPEWAPKVERWYQLDAFAYGMADAAHAWRNDPPPDAIFLASPGGSNATDAEFANAGARSPALFVHSLPNVRSSSFCQVLGWHGPLYCIQNDPSTIGDAADEALRAHRRTGASGWVVGIERTGTPGGFVVRRVRIGKVNK